MFTKSKIGSWLGGLSLAALCWTSPISASQHPAIETDLGTITGIGDDNGSRFMGIPYAQPPVGDLRWAPPQPVTDLPEPYAATEFSSTCPQNASAFGVASVNEDCLYLNVYLPEGDVSSFHNLPVMVWFHGGAFTYGGGSLYDPAPLVKKGVVVVTVNYRLGALGYLAHPALTAEQGASGNYGIMDQQLALQWVQDHISAFGGNENNVTIFGQSAGGLSSHAHLVSKNSSGLFHKAIIQSGAYLLDQPVLEQWELLGLGITAQAGCGADTSLECLRNLAVEDILANQDPGDLGWLPITDGKTLTRPMEQALASGDFNQVPVMQGSTRDDYTMFTALGHDLNPEKGPITNENYVQRLIDLGFPEAAAPLIAFFYPPFLYENAGAAYSAMGTDFLFACTSRSSLLKLSRHVTTYAYEFNDRNAPFPALPPVSFPYGAAHGAEIQYLMNTFKDGELTSSQKKLSKHMIKYWTNFAKRGNPNPWGSFFWPKYNGLHGIMMSLQTPFALPKVGFKVDHKCDFWTTLLSFEP